MFCTNCGNEIKNDEKFCISCGEPVGKTEKVSDVRSSFEKRLAGKMGNKNELTEEVDEKKKKLETKAWYRFLKVCYIFIFSAGILLIGGVSIGTFPSKTINAELSTVNCNNGKVYTLSKNNLYAYSYDNTLDSSNAEHARILCKYDTLDFYNYRYSNEFILQNYTFTPVYEYPNVGSHILYSILWLVGFILVVKLIKISAFF